MTIGFYSLAIGLILLAGGMALWLWSRSLEEAAGLPEGQVVYADGNAWIGNEDLLLSRHLRLVGKPDYLVEEADGALIPVELKSKRAPASPHEGHVLQLAAYCRLVHEQYGVRPTHGIIQYKDRAFAVDYSEDLEEDLLDVLAEMRGDLFEADVDRDHSSWKRCASCGVRSRCDQRLG